MVIAKQLLKIAAGLSFAVAIFQAVISFSSSWSIYFGAPEELTSSPLILLIAGLIAAVIFMVFGLYALAGAGYFHSLPILRLGLLGIGSVYTLRGLFVIPVLLIMTGVLQVSDVLPPQALASSLVSLLIGLVYLAGTILGWRELPLRIKN
jgi:hypothetical protein